MEVGCEGLHHGDFGFFGTDDLGHVGDDVVVDVQPGCQIAVGDVCKVAEDSFC